MKSIKVLPSAISSASYFFRDAAQRLASKEKLAIAAKWKEGLMGIAARQTNSEPSTPRRSLSPSRSANTNNLQVIEVSIDDLETKRTRLRDESEDESSLFEKQMTEWMVADKSSEPSVSSGDNLQTTSTSTSSGDSNRPSSPVIPSVSSSSAMIPKLTRSAISSRTRQLIKALTSTSNHTGQTIRLQELSRHLLNYPDAVSLCVNENAPSVLLRLRDYSDDRIVASHARQALALLGFAQPPKGRGLRILSIDGGGTRGVVGLEILKNIEQQTGKPIHQLFDLVCGVSTGAILTMLVGALRTNLVKCEELYRMTSQNLFKSDFWRGTSRLIMHHAYYDSVVWEKILKEAYSEKSLAETALQEDVPKVMAISASMTSPRMRPYVFRNYNLPEKSYGHYEGSCKHKIWQAVRASSSAPGYFEEFVLDQHVHQDGGILINNPAAIAIHEAQLLWPNEHIQCVVSIGTGKYTPSMPVDPDAAGGPTSLRAKITSFIESATDTEVVHRLLQDLLPKHSYFRINPTISEWTSLDETRPEKLDQLRTDGQMYVRKNEYKMKKVVESLSLERGYLQSLQDTIRLQYMMKK